MVRRNNLRDSLDVRQARQVRKLAKMKPLESSGINQGLVKFFGGYLVGEAGAKQEWHGDALFDGNVHITYALEVEGNTVIGGTVSITESLTVSAETILQGLTTLLNDMVVAAGGKIVIDGPIPFTLQNGAILFSNGTEITGDGDRIAMRAAGSAVTVGPSAAAIRAGDVTFTLDTERATLTGKLRVDGEAQFIERVVHQGPVEFQDSATFSGEVAFDNLPLAPAGSTSNAWVRPSDGALHQIV